MGGDLPRLERPPKPSRYVAGKTADDVRTDYQHLIRPLRESRWSQRHPYISVAWKVGFVLGVLGLGGLAHKVL